MDLTPGRQRLIFVVVAVVLVGFGIFLIKSRHSGGSSAATSPTASTPPSSASAGGSAGSQASGPPSSVPAATPASTAGGAEIYQWLPFTAANLSAAAQTTLTFAKDYSTWSYQESAADYAATMSALVAPPELAIIKNDYSTSGVAALRTGDKQVSTGTGTIDSIQSFAAGPSITFFVTINQQVTSTQPASTQSNQYAITVASSGGAWQVNNFELSKLGNTGNA
jgi:hypothetical protein